MSNTTSRVRGFKLTRPDGVVMAFTDHDHPLTIAGLTYEASTALTPSEAASNLGLAVDDQDVTGGLSSDAISEEDLAAGRYDGATVEVVEVDWTDTASFEVIGVYTVGEVSRDEAAFRCELRSRAALLQQTRGRRCLATCDAHLGDSRCKFNTSAPGWTGTGAVLAVVTDTDFRHSGLSGFTSVFFSHGLLTWTGGPNAGQQSEVRLHDSTVVGLWSPPTADLAAGHAFTITVGCDKSYETCRLKFSNGTNFRGFPTITGEDALLYATPGAAGLDGGSNNAFG